MKTSTGLTRSKSVRLPGFDYSGGGIFFVTICAFQRQCVFGDVLNAQVTLTPIGRIIEEQWLTTPTIRPGVVLDEFTIMPNHMHAVLFCPPAPDDVRSMAFRLHRPGRSLGSTIGGFKSKVTSLVRDLECDARRRVWQDGFHEHVVRNQRELEFIREYIRTNPQRWQFDRENPDIAGAYD